MRRLSPRVLAALCFVCVSTGLLANTYDFSYTFSAPPAPGSSPTVVAGSFDGTPNSTTPSLIDGVNILTLSIDGIALTPGFFTAQYDAASAGWTPGGVFSFDLAKNNFLISDSALVNYFWLVYDPSAVTTPSDLPGALVSAMPDPNSAALINVDGPAAPGTWHVQERAPTVPDGGSTAAALLLALALLGLVRRRR